jgi:hypothetical protein
MSWSVLRGVMAACALVLSATSASAAETVLTPDGPATVRGVWLGPVPAIGLPPAVAVGWTVTVGPGGNGGPVRLQLVSGDDRGTVTASSPTVDLPAAPGTYTYAIPAGQGLKSPSGWFDNVAVAQQVGGHAILRSVDARPEDGPLGDPAQLSVVDVFAPALADDARDVPRTERISARELAVKVISEVDSDQDGLGDKTQDVGDLRLVSAAITQHLDDRALVVAHVRNVGTTVRDQPRLSVPGLPFMPCWAGACGTVAPLPPGAEADLSLWVSTTGGEPTQAVVGDEGVDVNPADNTAALTPPSVVHPGVPQRPAPFVRLRAVRAAALPAGLRVSVGSAQEGSIRLRARAAGLTFSRTIRFAGAGRRVVTLTPARRADRRRLAAALRRKGRLPVRVTALSPAGKIWTWVDLKV